MSIILISIILCIIIILLDIESNDSSDSSSDDEEPVSKNIEVMYVAVIHRYTYSATSLRLPNLINFLN